MKIIYVEIVFAQIQVQKSYSCKCNNSQDISVWQKVL